VTHFAMVTKFYILMQNFIVFCRREVDHLAEHFHAFYCIRVVYVCQNYENQLTRVEVLTAEILKLLYSAIRLSSGKCVNKLSSER